MIDANLVFSIAFGIGVFFLVSLVTLLIVFGIALGLMSLYDYYS